MRRAELTTGDLPSMMLSLVVLKTDGKLTSLDHSTTCPSRQIEHKILRDRVEKGMNLGAYKRMSWKVSREVSRESAVDCSF
jgi:hypothetical protein